MAETPLQCDVAIVGGGLVGASLACALDGLGYRVCVIEQVSRQASDQPSYDDRTLALSHSSCNILQGLGIWNELADHATAIRHIRVSEAGKPGAVDLRAEESGVEAFGHVVEAREFGAVITRHIEQLDRVRMLCPATVAGIRTNLERVELDIRSGSEVQTIHCKLVVAADGAQSMIRESLGIDAERRDYDQTAVICNITPANPHHGRAFEMLTDSGPFAVLPHRGSRCGLVWSMPSTDTEWAMSLPDDEFMQQVQDRFGNALGKIERVGRRSSYPLKLVHAQRDIDERVVIMGNAAHAIHPVAAQGFNLGLRDVAVLAEILAGRRPDPGAADLLEEYSRWRRADHKQTVSWTDGMVRLFANPSPLAAAVRGGGMMLHALLPPLRRKLAAQAMGYRGRVPRLAMGMSLSRCADSGQS